jgi:hypothetical protein
MFRHAGVLVACSLWIGCGEASDAAAPNDAASIDVGGDGDDVPVPFVCKRPTKVTTIPETCNGATALCDRTYDRVTVPMTHNAMSNADEKFVAPNQNHGLARQLQDGVRGMMLDVHYYDDVTGRTDERQEGVAAVDQAFLCHGVCSLGKRPLLEGLCDLTTFLDTHRGEVLSIIFESYLTSADLADVVTKSGLTDYVYVHPKGKPWPSLRTMIAEDKRLVVFTEDGDGVPEWNHSAWKEIWDTPYTFRDASEFTCEKNRGDTSNALFLINHWFGRPLSEERWAREANPKEVLLPRVQECTKAAGRPPTFVGVDFYDVGALFEVVRVTNGL